MQSSVRPVDAVGFRLLALMESANKVPIWPSGYDASDTWWVVPVPGLTDFAITSHRSRNIVKLISPFHLGQLISLYRQHRGVSAAICFASDHEGPDDARCFVGHGDRRNTRRFASQQVDQARISG